MLKLLSITPSWELDGRALFAEPIACDDTALALQVYTFDVRGADAPPKMAYLCHRPLRRALISAALKDEVQGPFPCAWHLLPLDPASLALRSKANKCDLSCASALVCLWLRALPLGGILRAWCAR
jgi:hypothetical protein